MNAGGNYDLLVVKYNAAGSVIWSQQVNGNGNGDDYAADLQIDNSGNVIVTGTTFESSADSFNVLTVMYDSGGNQQWIASYNGSGSGNDGATSIYVDNASGDIYVAGAEWQGSSTLYDVLLIKYDSGGNQQWAATYDNTNLVDVAVRVRQNSGTGNIEVGGATQTTLTNRKYLVAEFDPSSGSVVNAYTSTSSTLGIENLTDLKTDSNGNVFVTGSVTGTSTGMDIRTLMLDTNLSIVWSATYSGAMNDEGNALDIDAAGNILVTGYTTSSTQGRNYITIKYNSAGSQLWAKTFNGGTNGDDSATCIVVHPTDTNKIYVSGYSYNGSTKDYYTLKYDGAGNQKWGIEFNNIYNTDDRATSITLDTTGNIIVAGQNKLNDTTHTYTTVKYIEHSVTLADDTIPGTYSGFVFIQNRGQLIGSDLVSHPEVKYYSTVTSPQIFFMDTAVAYVFKSEDTDTTTTDSLKRVDMKFVNANSDLKIRPMDEQDAYSNYFLAHIPDGRSKVPQYEQLVSFNVWNKVDVVFASNFKGLKYYFIGAPGGGGNPMAQIDLKYQGADSVKIGASGELIIYTRLGNVVQPKAAAWQLDASGNYQSLGWQPSYTILGTNEVGFTSFGSYNSTLPIVIAIDWGNGQPQNIANLSWSTFYGGGLIDQFVDVRTHTNGDVVATGNTSDMNFPALNSNYITYSGQRDITIIRFHDDGTLFWSALYGGTSLDRGNGVDVNPNNGNVFVVGMTQSYGFPIHVWGNAENNPAPANATNPEQFILQLSFDGQVAIWATCYGGAGWDEANDIRISNNGQNSGDIYVVGKGASAFPLYSQPSWSNGNGTILRFDDDGVLLMATYFGSSGGGELQDVTIDKDGDVVVVGTVPSGTGVPIQNAGGNFTYGGGATDGVICKFSGINAGIWWCTFYGGNADDAALSIETFKTPTTIFYYVSGRTNSTSGVPIVNPGWGYNQGSCGGSTDAFVVQISSWGYFMWSTYYGGTNTEIGWSITADANRNVFLCGETTGGGIPFPTNNLANAYIQSTFNGGPNDGFIVCFSKDVNDQLWTTYFGGTMDDVIYSATCRGGTYLYITGYTNCTNSFPLENAWDGTVFGAKGFLSQFELLTVLTGIQSDSLSDNSMSIYPNPADQSLVISSGCNNCETRIVIQNLAGQIVFEVNNNSDSGTTRIDVANLADGSYIVSVQSGDKFSNAKLIIQH